ncbi:MAG: replication-associated recombination protein A [Erysipelotrichaceae bacterium]|nr:replication-associated recombination protein A [Erysipelotrichaceae bacterium]
MLQESLFDDRNTSTPLADRMRPLTLDDYAGQEHLVGEGRVLRLMIERDELQSMIFWGPPGVGKTTLARIIANSTHSRFVNFSAVTSGIKEIKAVMSEAENNRALGVRTILFVDEIHRFNKAQQDAFLPYVEKGSIVMIGATTENPSFEINSALLSRCKVFVLNALSTEDLVKLQKRALSDERGFPGREIEAEDSALEKIAVYADGDARVALNTLEMCVLSADQDGHSLINDDVLTQVLSGRSLLYDKNGEEHYNIISALHKSMRNSDADAAVYWLARMLEAGEDPLYVARRVVRFASEDIGMADSRALGIAIDAYQACHYIGMPECTVHLTHAVVFCALAPKSNSLYTAYTKAAQDARNTINEPVPLQIRNAPTRLMEELGFGKDYQYAHDFEGHITPMDCLPPSLAGTHYYEPSEQGVEKRVKEHKEAIEAWKKAHRNKQ